MADLPIDLADAALAARLAASLDVEGKIPRAIEALGPVGGRDVVLVHGGDLRAAQLGELGARVAIVDALESLPRVEPASVDAVVAFWSAFRPVEPGELREADRILRAGGRLLIVHDYGRDDVSQLRGDRPEYGSWSRRSGAFLANGFRIRVIHCFWTFDSLEEAASFLGDAFGETGRGFAATLKRPRLSYNVAIYHRTKGGESRTVEAPGGAVEGPNAESGVGAVT